MNPAEILERFPSLSVLVVGDICLDRWCYYDPSTAEPSRETGIPRVGIISTASTPGAGGTVADNLSKMGVGRVAVLGTAGDDGFGWELRRALEARQIDSSLMVTTVSSQTFTYTKLINLDTQEEDLPRIDFVNTRPLDSPDERELIDTLQQSVEQFDVIITADQAETSQGGVVTPGVRQVISDLAPGYPDKVFIADSRARIELFRNVIIKPNQQEADEACRRLFGHVDYLSLMCQTMSRFAVVTRGGDGAVVVTERGEETVASRKVDQPVDICGAGDSFCAGFAAALAATRSPVEAVRFGNLVASVTIMKKGTGTASPEEILHANARY